MRVRGLRAAQPSPARSVTQSRRLAGACAEFQGLLLGGSRAPCAGCSRPCTYSCQAWADAGDVALSEVLSASGMFLECSRIHSPQQRLPLCPTQAHRGRGQACSPGQGAPRSAPLQMSAWPSKGPPGPASQLRGRTRDTEALTVVLQVPSAQFTSPRRILGLPGGCWVPLTVYHLQTHTPTCWKPPLPAWRRRRLPMTY